MVKGACHRRSVALDEPAQTVGAYRPLTSFALGLGLRVGEESGLWVGVGVRVGVGRKYSLTIMTQRGSGTATGLVKGCKTHHEAAWRVCGKATVADSVRRVMLLRFGVGVA